MFTDVLEECAVVMGTQDVLFTRLTDVTSEKIVIFIVIVVTASDQRVALHAMCSDQSFLYV
jgi:hypothetical protein